MCSEFISYMLDFAPLDSLFPFFKPLLDNAMNLSSIYNTTVFLPIFMEGETVLRIVHEELPPPIVKLLSLEDSNMDNLLYNSLTTGSL